MTRPRYSLSELVALTLVNFAELAPNARDEMPDEDVVVIIEVRRNRKGRSLLASQTTLFADRSKDTDV